MARAYYNEFDANAAAWLRELIKDGLIADGDVDERSIVDVQPSDLEGYTQCHFFAGIGGWSAALRLAGWPEDERVWTGSCPCQPFSAAGKRKGTDDERHLWPTFFRLIEACQPAIIFGEQVASADVVGKAGGSVEGSPAVWIDGVFDDLERTSYSCGAADFPAASVGAPHIRQRLYWGAARLADSLNRRSQARWPKSDGDYQQRYCDENANTRDVPAIEKHCPTHRLADAGHPKPGSRHSGPGGLDAAKRAQQSVNTSANGVDGNGLANAQHRRSPVEESRPESGSGGGDAGCGLEHSPRNGRQQRGAESNGRGASSGCGADGLGNANDSRPQGWFAVRQCDGELPAGTPGLGYWSDYRIIHCRDGKARRIPATQSGFQSVADGLSAGMDGVRLACLDRFPLAGKIPNRVMLLRGAGNAIVPEQASAFIEAFEESITVLARLQENEK